MSVFSKIWKTVESVVPKIGKVSILDIGKTVLFAVPEIIEDVTEFVGMVPDDKINAVCNEIRARTGIEEGAVDVIRDLPPDQEDRFFNSLADLIEIIAKNRMKVQGYFVEGAPPADYNMAVEYIKASLSGSGAAPAVDLAAGVGLAEPTDNQKASNLMLSIIRGLEKGRENITRAHAQGHIEYHTMYKVIAQYEHTLAMVKFAAMGRGVYL